MERIVMEGTPLTLEERIERQANEIRTKEQQIEQLKAENDHWQEVCADLHIEYGEQIEAQQQEITNYLKVIEQQRNTLARDSDSFNKQQQEIESLKRELNAEISVNEALTAYKDEQAGRIMRVGDGLEKAKQIFRNIEIITSCPETGNERNAMQMAIDGHRLMVAMLGGKEE